jgi:glycosyltransferase involved in cell wall biosynthesis
MSPLVSILIPTFDRPHYLAEAIDAALAQTYRNLEVLVFDNGTMDETLGVAQQAVRRDPRVRFQRNERNLGMSGNFNALFDAARGEFVVAIGDDDSLLPEFVAKLAAAMVPPVRVSFSNQYLIDANGRRLDERTEAHAERYGRDTLPAGVMQNADVASWQLSIPMSASLLHTADMRRLRFREDMNTPDIEFFIRLAREGAAFCFVPERLMEYRVHLGAETAGGLSTEQLVECLTPYKVRPEVEPYKRQFLAPMIVNAVSRCLQRGDMKKARALLRNKYYPRRVTASGGAWGSSMGHPLHSALERRNGNHSALRHSLGSFLQNFCAHLPAAVGAPIYRSVRRVRQASQGRSS